MWKEKHSIYACDGKYVIYKHKCSCAGAFEITRSSNPLENSIVLILLCFLLCNFLFLYLLQDIFFKILPHLMLERMTHYAVIFHFRKCS